MHYLPLPPIMHPPCSSLRESLGLEQKLDGRRMQEKNSQASWQEMEILALSESDVGPSSEQSAQIWIRPTNRVKKKKGR